MAWQPDRNPSDGEQVKTCCTVSRRSNTESGFGVLELERRSQQQRTPSRSRGCVVLTCYAQRDLNCGPHSAYKCSAGVTSIQRLEAATLYYLGIKEYGLNNIELAMKVHRISQKCQKRDVLLSHMHS